MANLINLCIKKLQYGSVILFSISSVLVSEHLLAGENGVLYTEGGVEVRRVATWNALGGSAMQYSYTKQQEKINRKMPVPSIDVKMAVSKTGNVSSARLISKPITPQESYIAVKVAQLGSINQPTVVSSKNTALIESVSHADSMPDDKPELNVSPDLPLSETIVKQSQRGLKVQTDDDSQNARALLEMLKSAKLESNNSKKRDDLKLSPDEKIVDDNFNKEPTALEPVKVKNRAVSNRNMENAKIKEIRFDQANILDVVAALSDISGLNFVATETAAKKSVTVFLQNISVINALETITKNSGLWYRKDKRSGVYRIMTTQEYATDLVVYREDITKVFRLLHPNPMQIATAIQDLYPNRAIISFGMFDDTFLQPIQAGGGAGNRSSGIGRSNNSRGRSNRGNQSLGARGGNARGGQQRLNTTVTATKEDLAKQVTSEQLANLDGQVDAVNSQGIVSDEQLKGFTAGQQPIYVTLGREQDLMIVRTSDVAAMKDIESLVKALDLPTKQVLLEMKILSLDVGDFYRRATDLDFMPSTDSVRGPFTDQDRNPLFTEAPFQTNTTETITTPTGSQTVTQSGQFSLGVSHILGLGNFALEGGTFVYQFLSDKIRARIQLLQQNNRINTLSSPILLTANKKPARVFVGVEQVVTTGFEAVTGTTNGLVATNPAIVPITEIRDIGNTLQVQPNINGDKTVTLLVQQDASTLVRGASAIPIPVGGTVQSFNVDSVRTSNIQGTVVAKDGLTIAIGGLIDATDSIEEQSVPFISEFPIIGEFFKREVKEKSKRELILLITPHIIETPHESDDVSRDVIEPITESEW